MDNKIMKCNWEIIDSFRSYSEFKRFLSWMDEQEKNGFVEKVSVKKPYEGSLLFEEKWYKCKKCNTIWRLVAPDPPFEGVFEPID